MSWTETWSATRLGSKLAMHVRPDGAEASLGITNTIARTGVANHITRADARALAAALIAFADEPEVVA